MLMVTFPFLEETQMGSRIEAVLSTLVLSMAMMAVGGQRFSLAWAATLLLPTLLLKWLNQTMPETVPEWPF